VLKRRFKLIKQGLDDGAVLSDLNDVSSGSATNGQTIVWNGTAWVPGDVGDISGTLASTDISDFTEAAQDAAGAMAALTGVGVDLVYDDGAATLVANLDISNLTADATPDTGADYVATYDDSAGTHKKVLLSAIGGSSSPLTTKGDLYGYDSSDARIPIGTDGYILTADSAQTLGLKWAANAATVDFDVILTAGGEVLIDAAGNVMTT
jgi:hypothetical protein